MLFSKEKPGAHQDRARHHRLAGACTNGLVMLLVIVAAGGCAIGPKWHDELSIPSPAESLNGRKIIVTDFRSVVRSLSYTGSHDVMWLLESVSARDISSEVARELAGKGLLAEARINFKPEDLREGEVLLRGGIAAKDQYKNMGTMIPNVILFACSLTVIGMILPSPIPCQNGAVLAYHVEVIDPEGRVLMHTGLNEIIGSYNDHYLMTEAKWGTYMGKLAKLFTPKLAGALADTIKSGEMFALQKLQSRDSPELASGDQ